ncbi:MAG: aminoglycoside phosphotransferase family protein [Candidatus Latescibacteria bacterium]|nr:aminoglycoside phosphotransferase family protein [Candidatus Latescibacterota bacterium]
MSSPHRNTDDSPAEAARALLSVVGESGGFGLERLTGGRNNRVFRLDTAERSFLLKIYFRDDNDTRDRLGSEFGFISYAWERGIRSIPQPFAEDRQRSSALYGFIEGRKLTPGSVDAGHIRQAMGFYTALNGDTASDNARRLPDGSESCFSIREHLSCVDRRISRLKILSVHDDVSLEARRFVERELKPSWERLRSGVLADARDLDPGRELTPGERCISPSDFGFHNAVLDKRGSLYFIDFEYAGWDDPAKTVCDFFCQPEVPVPMVFFPAVFEGVAAVSGGDALQRRVRVLLPVYRLKWSCIALNDFLAGGSSRRRFSDEPGGGDARIEQLATARAFLTEALIEHPLGI